jgi:transcriptional regulator with XRE-family HTH domain
MFSRFVDSFYHGDVPNKFTIVMGELIRKARIDAKMSQSELAEIAHFRQASISQIESGKKEVSSTDLLMLSYALNKPIMYFFPSQYVNHNNDEGNLPPLHQELLFQVSQLVDDDVLRLIAQTRALVEFNKK